MQILRPGGNTMTDALFDPKKQYSERELMQLAVTIAGKSVAEDDGRIHPSLSHDMFF
jgi:hypothetical protein